MSVMEKLLTRRTYRRFVQKAVPQDVVEDIIEAANSKPLLVAYWFKHDLTRISERLRKLHIPFSKLDDAASIRRWNNDLSSDRR